MKPFLEVEENRKKYYSDPTKNTVHRSSLIVPNMPGARPCISFLNHFLIKRGQNKVSCKLTAISNDGKVVDSKTFLIDQPIAYSFYLDEVFDVPVKEYLVEFFSGENLFIPFPAVMVNHVGKDFCNSIHSYNRILNDIFEDDAVNKVSVKEASIDVVIDESYDTVINFATGPFEVNSKIVFTYEKDEKHFEKSVPLIEGRLSNKAFSLSEIFPEAKGFSGGVLKVLQPQQSLFYGRMIAGIVNRKTGAFSANHSYYDSSESKEYFKSSMSSRSYPFFPELSNKVVMYPIMSPSQLNVFIRLVSAAGLVTSDVLKLKSPSAKPIAFDINALVRKNSLNDVTGFTVCAESQEGGNPTRINHQLVYGNLDGQNKICSSVNVSLLSSDFFKPQNKPGFIWGQFLLSKKYKSYLGVTLNDVDSAADDLQIEFYKESGLFKTLNMKCQPGYSVIVSSDDLGFELGEEITFSWYVIKSSRPDLTAIAYSENRLTGNASGEHNF